MSLKGRTLIELQDKDGNIKTYKDNNMVTNAFTDVLRIMANTSTTGSLLTTERYALAELSNRFNGVFNTTDLNRWGVRLFEEPLEEDADKYFIHRPHLAYANETTSMEEKKGVFNTLSSKFLTNDIGQTIGIRLVWDFSTNVANGKISCISLTPSINTYNSNRYNLRLNTLCTDTPMAHNGVFTWGVPENSRRELSYTKEGIPIKVKNNTIYFYKNTQPTISHLGWYEKSDIYDKVVLDNYIDLFKVYDLENYYLTLGKNTETQKYELIKLNKETYEIDETRLIGNFDLKNQFDYSIVGVKSDTLEDLTNVLYFSNLVYTSSSTNRGILYSINLKTLERKDVYWGSSTNYAYYNSHCFSPMLDENGDISTKVTINRGGSSYCYVASGTFKLNESKDDCVLCDSFNINGMSSGLPIMSGINFGLKPIFTTIEPYGSSNISYHKTNVGYDHNTVFTINNLETPITKTEDNTMKITYELTWGE